MEPLSLVISALVAGAGAALKPTAELAVKDAYGSLKAHIRRRWQQIDVDALEREPGRALKQQLVREDLAQTDAGSDRALLEQARAVLAMVRAHDRDAALAGGISIEHLEAGANANIEDLLAEGAIRVRGVRAAQDINIRGLRSANPPRR